MPVALISVSDKSGLIDFASRLQKLGWSLLASGGTAQVIREAGLLVEEVSDYTCSPEILNGRVKTLHPVIHGGILARDLPDDLQDLETIHASLIDLVVVNLYPFSKTIENPQTTLAEAIEMIDIGGVALVRAAAKNHERVTVVTDPEDYELILAEMENRGSCSPETRKKMALKAFALTAQYDSSIINYLSKTLEAPSPVEIPGFLAPFPATPLRYGENPHQKAILIHLDNRPQKPLGAEVLQGKELSYNNLLDLDAALRAVISFEQPTAVIVKHLSPCGIASDEQLVRAFQLALECDPVSAFGGILALNRECDEQIMDALGQHFLECIIAPAYSHEVMQILQKKKNCRVLLLPDMTISPNYEIRSINHGLLMQERDTGDTVQSHTWRVATHRTPTAHEMTALQFAWKACQHVKSNAIVFARGTATVGLGGGQPNRVDCVRIAASRAGEKAAGAVMASDAFFPFPDSIEEAAKAGITAIIQPGGSVRDEETIEAANNHHLAMIFTGFRHFRH
jgi:phosphoribosylaminoimidazolecarboxamide formyltransferase/IMP cyclohydrolase